jgi:hypothetical protein
MLFHFLNLPPSLYSWFFFLFWAGVLSVCLIFHNQFRSWWAAIMINLVCLGAMALCISTPAEWALCLIGGAVYTFIDAVAVWRKMWKYNTSHGYVFWAGAGWGLLTIIIYRLFSQFDLFFAVFLLLLTSFIAVVRHRDELNIHLYSIPYLIFSFLCIILFPQLFIIAFGMGVLIEFTAVEVFKTWKYPRPHYLYLGMGYGLLLCFTALLFSLIHGNASVPHFVLLFSMVGYYFIHELFLKRKQKRRRSK